MAENIPPESVDFSRFDWADFGKIPLSIMVYCRTKLEQRIISAFAVPNSTYGLDFEQDDSAHLLQRLVDGAHANGKRVKLSIGGWGGSKYFSPAMCTPESRATFVDNIVTTYHQFGLDGIDM